MTLQSVSVIIPSFNHAEFIENAIISVLNQASNELDVQLIVVDDQSHDNTRELIVNLKKEHDFEFYENAKNVGVNQTIENGLQYINGEYVAFLASDDFLLQNSLKKQINYINEKEVDVVYGKGIICDDEGTSLGEQNLLEFDKALSKDQKSALNLVAVDDTCGPLMQSALFKRDLALELCAIRREFKSDDWIVLLYLLKRHKVGFLNDFVFGYRLHENNNHKDFWLMFLYRMEVIVKYVRIIDEGLMSKAISNLFVSQGMALYRNGRKKIALSFILSSFVFSFPYRKIKIFFGRLLGGR
tara:strand:+ start:7713 stop:8609 length:897 start_codon:yes stop_codon:yes gene_type:complete